MDMLRRGQEDLIVSKQVGYKLEAELCDAKFVLIEECGHIPHEE